MATLTISFSDEEMRRLKELSKRETLTVEEMVRFGIHDFISQPDDAFHAAAKRVMEKNAAHYRRLSRIASITKSDFAKLCWVVCQTGVRDFLHRLASASKAGRYRLMNVAIC